MASIINALSSGTGGIVTSGDASGILQLQTANTAAVTIDGSQNVGIGVVPSAWYPTYRALSIGYSSNGMFSGGAIQLGLTQNAYLDSGLNYVYTTSNPASQYIQQSGVHTWRSAASGTAGNAITFTQLLAVEKDKSLALQGATSATGTGIAFPATQSASSDANTLDDYEEGTWTPTITFGGGSTGIAYSGSSRLGKYTKIGNMVYAGIQFTLSSKGSSTGSAVISGLPYASSSAQESRMGTCASYYGNFNTASGILLLMEASATNSSLRYITAGTVTDMNDTHFQNGSSMYGVFIYQTP